MLKQIPEILKKKVYIVILWHKIIRMQFIWELITFTLLLPFSYYSLQIWYRWGKPDPQFLSFSASTVQILSIITLLGVQTELGKRVLIRLYARFKKHVFFRHPIGIFILAFFLTCCSGSTYHWGLPILGDHANQQGINLEEKGQFSQAVRKYQLAISLVPENSKFYFNLGNAYESLYNYEQAIFAYQKAIELDDTLLPAYNNLGHVYLDTQKDANTALAVLLAGYANVTTTDSIADPIAVAVFHKNIGWAYLEKNFLSAALTELTQADNSLSKLNEDEQDVVTFFYHAEVYRLLSHTYELMSNPVAAKDSWSLTKSKTINIREKCRRAGARLKKYCSKAEIWLAEAKEHL